MNVLAVIPARGGSKGIPRKNVRPLAGKPLLAWSIDAFFRDMVEAGNVWPFDVAVSTEDREIASIAGEWGAIIIDRPLDLATDEALTAPVIAHAASCPLPTRPDAVVVLQPTVPFRRRGLIRSCLEAFDRTKADALLTVTPLHFAWWKENGYQHAADAQGGYWRSQCPRRPRRQDMYAREIMYQEDGAVFVVSREYLEKSGSHVVIDRFPGRQEVLIHHGPSVDIDTEDDFVMAEALVRHQEGLP